MILQALKEYYERKAADSESGIAPRGFEKKEFPFLIVIDADGRFVNLEDTRGQMGRRLVGNTYTVPRSWPRSGSRSYETTFLLWDHFGYLLQHPEGDEKAAKQHKTWIETLRSLSSELRVDEGISAILKFYGSDGVRAVKSAANWTACAALPTCNMTFKLAGDLVPVPCRSAVQEYVKRSATLGAEDEDADHNVRIASRCLVTGEIAEIARVHGRTPISKDSKSLVGFQRNSGYDSYGKEQGYNAPVGKPAEFAYTTALNTLLKSGSSRMKVGDATTVFWSAKRTDTGFEDFFSELWRDDPDKNVAAVKSLYESPKSGTFATDWETTRFYVLGLAPNVARIAIRFWIVNTVAEMATRVREHFDDIKLGHGLKDRDTISLKRLLSVAAQQDEENISPNVAGETMRAILSGSPYPQTLLQAAIRRIRAEHEITYPRAALIKACINRSTRFKNHEQQEEIQVSLDTNNTNVGYRLGRLFATLEKIQQEASPGLNATIRDRFYGAASSTPVTVFGNLMRLKNHHLAKLERSGRRVFFEKLLGQIIDGVSDFPSHLKLEDQGRFAIGYYHQGQDFYTKKSQ